MMEIISLFGVLDLDLKHYYLLNQMIIVTLNQNENIAKIILQIWN